MASAAFALTVADGSFSNIISAGNKTETDWRKFKIIFRDKTEYGKFLT